MENPYKEITRIQKQHLTASQVAMQSALLELSRNKKIYEINVKELCQKAAVARSTFYAYYQNIDDLLIEIENQLLYILIQNNEKIMKREYQSKEDFLFYKETIQFVEENEKVFKLFWIEQPNYRFIKKWKQAIKYHLFQRKDYVSKNDFMLEVIASATISAYSYWLENPQSINYEEVSEIISKVLSTFN